MGALLADRFWSKVQRTDTCWLWTAARTHGGYGQFGLARGKAVRAHRLAYELTIGPIPDGLELDHLCRVRNCVNPAHLEPVTHAENMRRAVSAWAITHCPAGHEYTPDNIVRSHPGLVCRTCHNARNRRSAQARRARAVA
jgi:HNH endonuclease